MFDWKFQQFCDNSHWLALTGEEGTSGINGAIMKKNHPGQPVTNSISVEDFDATVAAISASGGKIVVRKTVVHGVGWMAYFSDPEGNIFGIWKEDPTAS